jgi:hypothetical protein
VSTALSVLELTAWLTTSVLIAGRAKVEFVALLGSLQLTDTVCVSPLSGSVKEPVSVVEPPSLIAGRASSATVGTSFTPVTLIVTVAVEVVGATAWKLFMISMPLRI